MAEKCRRIFKDFGKVPCGQKCKKLIKLTNESKKTQLFTIQPKESHYYDPPFEIEPNQFTIKSNDSASFSVSYLDFVPNVCRYSKFVIKNEENPVAILTQKAESFESDLRVSKCNIQFFSPGCKTLEFVNSSPCPTKFQFDIKEDDWITISGPTGVIPGNRKMPFKIIFSPKSYGVYFKKIFCLFQFHKPIIFHIAAVHKPKSNPQNLILNYPTGKKNYENNFELYLNDLIEKEPNVLESPCLSSRLKKLVGKRPETDEFTEFSSHDFEGINKSNVSSSTSSSSESEKSGLILTQHYVNVGKRKTVGNVTILMNLSKSINYIYEWDYASDNCFRMDPPRGIISPNGQVQMSVHFNPEKKDQIYYEKLDLKLVPGDANLSKATVNLPMTLSLSLLGDSFPAQSCGWIAQYSIKPNPIILPPCLPGEIVYTTAIIKKQGHLPLAFQFLPPVHTNFTIKPPLGFVTESFQCLVIRFDSKSVNQDFHSEDWKIIFNNSEKQETTLKLIAPIETPKIILGKNNSYYFETTYPGHESKEKVTIENPTHFSLGYEFFIPEDIPWLKIPNSKGVIEPFAEKFIEVVFHPLEAGEYLDYVTCTVSPAESEECCNNVDVQFSGSSQYGFLVALPDKFDFGECPLGSTKQLKVTLFNYTPTILRFNLIPVSKGFEVTNPSDDIKIIPNEGKVYEKEQVVIEIFLTSHSKQFLEYSIISTFFESRPLLDLSFEGVIPSVQVVDLNVINGGPLFSPYSLWKMMEINQLNEILGDLKPGETHCIPMNFPDAELNSHEIKIILLLKALKYGGVSWAVKRNATCGCPPSEKQVGASKRNRFYDCPHRRTMNISPQKGTLAPGEEMTLEVTIKHELLGFCQQEWVLELSENRKIFISADILSLSNEEASAASMYLKPSLKFNPTFIGESEPPAQLFWLYNNTIRPSSYILDKTALKEAVPFSCKTFECVNPLGIIPPFSCTPLIFIFKPPELQQYMAEILLCTNIDDPTRFSIEGEGIPFREPFKELSFEKTIPKKPIINNPEIDLIPSVNIIHIKPFPTFIETHRIFYVKNISKTKAWAFQWHTVKFAEILKTRVEPSMGLIQPGESALMKVVIESLSQPANISFSIPCDVMDFTNLEKYEASRKLKELTEARLQNHFTMTKKNSFQECPSVKVSEKPQLHHFFITVNTSIVSFQFLDERLSLEGQLNLKFKNEIQYGEYKKPVLEKEEGKIAFEIMEKILWLTIDCKTFQYGFETIQESEKHRTYLQLIPRSKKEEEEIKKSLSLTPSNNLVQRLIENSLLEIINNQFKQLNEE